MSQNEDVYLYKFLILYDYLNIFNETTKCETVFQKMSHLVYSWILSVILHRIMKKYILYSIPVHPVRVAENEKRLKSTLIPYYFLNTPTYRNTDLIWNHIRCKYQHSIPLLFSRVQLVQSQVDIYLIILAAMFAN